ncbi:metalloregulator ArsR/SmtB family transcription factor [Thalassomonas haliotis]|uniref:Metalloregulator ArsR/SmtB family transcription factor n=1 Tax=Thalassomonas haliotis TaxID=485448 RepID=A0ABY7VHJ8_9GAMM|nr:metalloregulator ArsR/SmtB family transcription factor [Thalassomonas haliotis]WDE13021.1 metalloregulator ArsR/SmtB family transcription factor [Thalassomonas haliotis]
MQSLQFFKALSDDTRLQLILLIFAEQELCVCELTQALDLSQPKISRHIAILRQLGLLTDRRAGKWVFYSLSDKLANWQFTAISDCCENSQQYLALGRQRLLQMGNRPDRQLLCCP